MAGTVIKRVIQSLKKLKPKPKPKKTWSKKNVGIGKIKDQKLYKTLGKDKYGDVQIITKGPQKGYRVPKYVLATFSYTVLHAEAPSLSFSNHSISMTGRNHHFYGINNNESVGV